MVKIINNDNVFFMTYTYNSWSAGKPKHQRTAIICIDKLTGAIFHNLNKMANFIRVMSYLELHKPLNIEVDYDNRKITINKIGLFENSKTFII